MGLALSSYKGLRDRGFDIVALFDNDVTKIGATDDGLPILPIEQLKNKVKKYKARIGIITVPANAAQEVADQLVGAGIEAIINFAPMVLNLPANIEVRSVDLTANLEVLSFNLGKRG